MPRSKKAASRGQGRGGYGNKEASKGLGNSSMPFGETANKAKEYTMQSEALNTQRQQALWDSDRRLRHAKINFVSAGGSERLKPADPNIPLAEMTLNDLAEIISHDQRKMEVDHAMRQSTGILQEEDHANQPQSVAKELFVIDSQGGDPVVTGFSPPQIRSPSPSSSDSSDEVVLFRGRNNAGKDISKQSYLAEVNAHFCNPKAMAQDTRLQRRNLVSLTVSNKGDSDSNHSQSLATLAELPVAVKDGPLSTLLQPYRPTTPKTIESGGICKAISRKPSSGRRSCQTKGDHEQAVFEDYIQNIDSQGSGSELTYNQRGLGGTGDDTWQETDASSGNTFENPSQTEFERSELCELNNSSTSDEGHGSVQAILSKRDRKGEVQYLGIWEDCDMNKARWVPASALTKAKAMTLIKQFEAKRRLMADTFDFGNMNNDSSPNNDSIGDEESDPANDDIDLQQQNLHRVTDEQVARLIAKQEKFDMGFADLMLSDGFSEIDMCNGDMPVPTALNRPQYRLQKGLMTKRSRGEFPAAAALADSYDGFDIMDFERPSLKNKPKGRKGKPVFDLSDSDQRAIMQMAWENDRSKKKQRKMQRQELLTQGLLGKKDKPDLKVKYKEGMSIHDVKDEIKSFLISEKTTLALPPMEKADRKIVHEFANAFNLNSKSAGNGQKRFPVLYRTSHTLPYVESKFVSVEARLTRRYLPRKDLQGKGQSFVSKRSGQGGSANAAVTYKDGDIVGGSAPELGIENRGRAMLEKMGWSTGTALGALNNKGILEPVPHVVKTTKAGLG